MKKVYAGIDIGNDTIKIVVNEFVNNRFYVLASTSVKTRGIRNGVIMDSSLALKSLLKAKSEIEEVINNDLDEAIIKVPSNDVELTIVSGNSVITGVDNKVTSDDIINCLQDAVLGKISSSYEIVTVVPISFNVDDEEGVKDPLNHEGENLSVKAVISTVPKKNLTEVFNLFKDANINVVDIAFSSTGDYYEAKNNNYDQKVGAIVNIGYENTIVSIYNKGIMIKEEILPFGAKNVDKDINYVYNVSSGTAKFLKENFAICNVRYADPNDTIEVKTKDKEIITINMKHISEVVEARLVELFRLIRNTYTKLTPREIGYVVLTGGLTEMAGFQYLIDVTLGDIAKTLNMTTMGIRNNKYSSASGITKYFHYKMELRGKKYSMFDEFKEDRLLLLNDNNANNNIVNKIFGNIFSNN